MHVLQGKYVVLFFYPLDFTFVCPTEITAFSDRHGDFEKLNAEVCYALAHCHLQLIFSIGTQMDWYCDYTQVFGTTSPQSMGNAGSGCLCGLTVLSSGLVPDRYALQSCQHSLLACSYVVHDTTQPWCLYLQTEKRVELVS